MEELFETLSDHLNHFVSLLQRQYQRTYDELDTRKIMHICAIVGGYIIVRPFIMKLFGRDINSKSDKGSQHTKRKTKAGVPEKTSPNTLRYGPLAQEVEVSDDTASDNSDAEPVTEEDKKDQMIRRRQRRLLRAKLDEDAMEKFADDEWNDPDIADLLPETRKS